MPLWLFLYLFITFNSNCEMCRSIVLKCHVYGKFMDGKAYLWHEFEVSVWLITPCLQISLLCPPHWGVDILFLLFPPSGVRRPTWFPDILGNSSYPIFTKCGMQVYWVNSLYGIAFGDDSSIANRVIATLLLLSSSLVSRHFKECY